MCSFLCSLRVFLREFCHKPRGLGGRNILSDSWRNRDIFCFQTPMQMVKNYQESKGCLLIWEDQSVLSNIAWHSIWTSEGIACISSTRPCVWQAIVDYYAGGASFQDQAVTCRLWSPIPLSVWWIATDWQSPPHRILTNATKARTSDGGFTSVREASLDSEILSIFWNWLEILKLDYECWVDLKTIVGQYSRVGIKLLREAILNQ